MENMEIPFYIFTRVTYVHLNVLAKTISGDSIVAVITVIITLEQYFTQMLQNVLVQCTCIMK